MGDRRRSVAPALVAGATVALALAFLVLGWQQVSEPADLLKGYGLPGLLWAVTFGLVGALVMRDSPGNRLGPLFAFIGLLTGVGNVGGAAAGLLPAGSAIQGLAAVANGLWMVTICGFLMVPVLYPDSRQVPPRWRAAFRVQLTATIVSVVAWVVSPDAVSPNDNPGVVNPIAIGSLSTFVGVVAACCVLLVVAIGLVALVAQILRARHAEPEARARVAYLAATVLTMFVAMPFGPTWVNLALQVLAAVFLTVGVVRRGLFDVDRVLSRSVAYGIVLAGASLAALGTAALLGSVTQVGVLPAVAAAATALVLATGFARIQRAVDRVIFGARPDPVTALSLLGERLDAARDPEDVLPQLVTTVRETLNLPYVGVTLAGESVPAASDGTPARVTTRYPLRYGRVDVGSLELGLRGDDQTLSARDARLVQTLAAQAGSVAHSAQSARELRRSREQLVVAREEERRALRRDLHDGLGPTLAGMSLGLQSLERGATSEEQMRLAADLLAQSRRGLEEVRRMARDLRPAALDELGLAEALRQHAQTVRRMSGGALDVELTLEGDLPELPAAVEVAAYRISQEALSNTTRHADATRCVIDLSVNGSLVLSIADDGTGVAPNAAGTGLRSMRERADELGGTCTVTFRPGIGTEVLAHLPIVVVP